MIEKWKVLCKENVNPKIARVCSKHFDSSQYKDTLWLRRILPTYSPVNSRKLKPNAIPMEFVEEAQAIVKNDLETYVETHFTQVATDCDTLSSMSPVASRSESFVASSYSTSEMALCSSSPTALSSCSRKDDNFGSSQVSYDNAKIQQLIQENADLLLKNKVLQQQLARKNKLFKKEMKKKFQDMLSPFFTPGQIKMTLNPMQKMTVQSLRHFD
ncbi:PREDICTED: uncharacterized protein LOC108770498 [Trachymyrmex cornetzi]|uniref:uncharacterized protein LOC108770498 n=1 Tax=Trachymyrmex cornetzi TaxID=471704 RepID=UPI00084EE05B|nr:PREDICTED: uncharacterized protein LOC108770498 [Trachymyrmex cornetzi]